MKVASKIIAISLVLIAGSALAQTTTSTQTASPTPLQNIFDKVDGRFLEATERLDKITARLDSRIEKIRLAGGKTEDAEKFEADAKKSLEAAKTSITSFELKITQALVFHGAGKKTEFKTALISMIETSQIIRRNLMDARLSLAKAIAFLKGLSQLQTTQSTNN